MVAAITYPFAHRFGPDQPTGTREPRHIDEHVDCNMWAPARLNWGDDVQWYLQCHGWSPSAITTISWLWLECIERDEFIEEVSRRGMPRHEAEYLQFLIHKEAIQRDGVDCFRFLTPGELAAAPEREVVVVDNDVALPY